MLKCNEFVLVQRMWALVDTWMGFCNEQEITWEVVSVVSFWTPTNRTSEEQNRVVMSSKYLQWQPNFLVEVICLESFQDEKTFKSCNDVDQSIFELLNALSFSYLSISSFFIFLLYKSHILHMLPLSPSL